MARFELDRVGLGSIALGWNALARDQLDSVGSGLDCVGLGCIVSICVGSFWLGLDCVGAGLYWFGLSWVLLGRVESVGSDRIR